MKYLKYFFTLSVVMSFLPYAAFSQNKLEGKVIDKNTNTPLVGASITILGTTKGSNTDAQGTFVLHYNKMDTLFVSYIGYQPKKIVLHDESQLNIPLQESQTALNQVIVSASRNEKPREDTPMAISTIGASSIRETKATSLDQLLNQTAGVYMVDLGNEQHTMAIRQPLGYNDYYLYLEDGIPIRPTGDFNHNGLIEINSEAAQRIEVIRGPASSIYGSEAVGGAINFITKKPSLTPKATLETEWGTRDYKRINLDASTMVNDKLGFAIAGYYADRSQKAEYHNDFHKYAINARADYRINDKTSLTGTFAYIDYFADGKGDLDSLQFYDKDYTQKPISNQRFTNRTVKALRARLSLQHKWSERSHTDLTAYYRNNSIGQIPSYRIGATEDPHIYTGEINRNAFRSYGTLIQHTQNFDWWNAEWIVGGNFDFTPQKYDAALLWINKNEEGIYEDYYRDDQNTMISDYAADLYNSALYIQLELSPIENLKIILGSRYDRLDYHYKNHLTPSPTTGPKTTKNHFSHFTPKIGLTYDFGGGLGLYANHSVGFSPPNISSLYSGYSVPNLKPSSFYNYEIGGWYSLGNRGYAEIAIYRLDGKDEVVSIRQSDGTSLSTNAGKTRHEGVELSVHYSPTNDLSLQLGGTYAQHQYIEFIDGNTDVSGNKMKGAPPYIINTKATYKPHFIEGFRISLEWQGLGKYYTDPENQHTYKGYHIFNLRTGYNFKGFEIWANLMNFTNRVYATTAEYKYGANAYTPGQLIQLQVGLGYHF